MPLEDSISEQRQRLGRTSGIEVSGLRVALRLEEAIADELGCGHVPVNQSKRQGHWGDYKPGLATGRLADQF